MGNCIKPSTRRYIKDADMEAQHQEEMLKGNGDFKAGGTVRIKIALTKEELGWLMFRLRVNGDDKKIEDVLRDIEGRREKGKAWKPSLESIEEEIPEGLEVER